MPDIRQDILNYGKPTAGTLVALSQKVLKSTKFFEPGASLSPQRFFDGSSTLDGYWNNFKFPLTETCMDILGIRITHNFGFTTVPVDAIADKAQQVFEGTSFLKVKYRQRSERLRYNLSMLTESTILANGNDATQYAKQMSVHDCGFYVLKSPLQIGGQQDIEWLVDIQQGFTLAAADALGDDAQFALPNSGSAEYFLSVELLVEEKGETAI